MFVDLIYPLVILCAGILAIPYIVYKSIRRKKYRHGWAQKLLGAAPNLPPTQPGAKRIWLHGVSVGEVNLLKSIVRELEKKRPDWEYVVSATSETGFELARKLFGDRAPVFYCPLDFKPVVDRAVRRIKPDLLVLVELELWPGLVKAAHDAGVRVAIINGRISDRSFKRYRLVKGALAPTFRRIDLVAAQDELAAGYFKALSPRPERVSVVGSVKFDGVQTNRANPATERLAKLAGIESDDALIRLCGDYTVSFGREAMEALMALPEPPTAVMATADTLAAGVLQAAYAAGLHVPGDLSVCGYDNVLSQALSPAIDSVGLSLKGLGETVLNLLEKRRKSPEAPTEILDIETDYISRGTVTAPKA